MYIIHSFPACASLLRTSGETELLKCLIMYSCLVVTLSDHLKCIVLPSDGIEPSNFRAVSSNYNFQITIPRRFRVISSRSG